MYISFMIIFIRMKIIQTDNSKNHGLLEDFRLVLHGTAEAPDYIQAGPRVYDENYNTVQNKRSVRKNKINKL